MLCKSKLLSLLLIAAALVQLASCASAGSGNVSSDDTSAAPVTGESASETNAEEEAEYFDPSVDYNGRTVTFTGYDYDGAWVILNYNIGLEEENGEIINDSIVKRNRTVEENLNVNIELIPLSGSDRSNPQVIQKYILSQDDVITVGTQMAAGLPALISTKGMLIDMKEIPTLNLDASWWNSNANEEYTLYGKQLTALGDINFFNLGAPIVLFYSKELAENNGLGSLYQLVYDGEWVLDEMIRMSEITAKDVNGNGEVDVEDIFGFAGEADTTFYTAYTAGVRFSERRGDEISITVNSEKAASVSEKIVKLLNDKNTTIYSSKWTATFPTSVFAEFMMPKLMKNELLFFSNQLHVALSMRQMESDFGILPMPKYDEAQDDYNGISNGWFADHVIIPATNSDLEMTGHLLDAMGYYAQQYITPSFIDVSVKDKAARDEDSVNMINMIYSNQVFDIGYIFNWGDMKKMFTGMISSGKNFASSWAEIESKVESELALSIEMLSEN